jgi:hypothetical protein
MKKRIDHETRDMYLACIVWFALLATTFLIFSIISE